MQVSLISLRPELEKIESHPEIKIKNRLEIIEKCAKKGIRVVIRIQPFIPIFCEKGLKELIEKVSELGAKAITIEYLKIPSLQLPPVKKAILNLSEILGYDLPALYKKFGNKTATDFELKPEFKKLWILKTKKLSHEHGLEFYCADNEFRSLGDSGICCGVGREEGFQCRNEVRTGKIFDLDKNIIRIEDILSDEGLLSAINKHWINAGNAYKGSMTKKQSLMDVFKIVWNNPKSELSPCNFYNNVDYIGRDKNNNAIYKKRG